MRYSPNLTQVCWRFALRVRELFPACPAGRETRYDELLGNGYDRREAWEDLEEEVLHVLAKWERDPHAGAWLRYRVIRHENRVAVNADLINRHISFISGKLIPAQVQANLP